MNCNYNDVLKYVVDAISNLEREIDMALGDMDRWRCPLDQARCGDDIENAIRDAISDYEWDNDDQFEEDEVLDDILSEKDFEDVLFDALEYKDKNEHVNEAVFNKYKRNPYKETHNAREYETPRLRDDISLFDIRQRLMEIMGNCNAEDIPYLKKQVSRLYKMVDAMINQGYEVNK